MNVIISENKTVKTMLGDQKLVPGTYRPSVFNYIVKVEEILAFNTFTRMLAILTQEECELLESKEIVVESVENTSEALEKLIEKRFIVPVGTDESESYRQLSEVISLMRGNKDITAYTILPTTACNARCFYCFEADFKTVTMTPQIANDMADYIIRNSKDKNVRLHWFGGEPLCNKNAMDIICNKLKENGFTYGASVTSNGLLFDDETVKKAKEDWHVSIVQITMDGMREVHNCRKSYVNCNCDPFETTIRHIRNLLDHEICVKVRLNFDKENLESIEELTHYLKDQFGGHPRFVAYPAILFEDCGAWNPDRLPEEQQELMRLLSELRDKMTEMGIYYPPKLSRDLQLERCGANNKGHRDVTPEGKFSVCHNVGDVNVYGSIYDGIVDQEKFDKWTNNVRILEGCRDCCWLPECTCFDQCPIKRSTCREDEQDIMKRKLIREYRKYLRKQEEA